MKPAEYVVEKLGGVRPAARKLGYSPSGVSYWRRVGTVPTKARKVILKYAKKNKIDITPEHLEYGKTI